MNCKPPCLAIVIRGLTHPSPNVGRIVEVVSRLPDHESFGPRWHCKSTQALQVVTHRGVAPAEEFWIPDAWLRPVSGLPVHEQQRGEVPA